MKKSLLILCMVVVIAITSLSIVYAATGNVTLKLSNETVKPGDTFTVTLHAECAEGINAVFAKFSYDTEKLDLVSGLGVTKDDESEFWVNLNGSRLEVDINDQRTEPEGDQTKPHITSADVYVLTFKVKDSASIGSTAFVKAENIKVDSDLRNDMFTVEPRNVTVKIENETSTPSDTSENDNQNQNQEQNQNQNTTPSNTDGNQPGKSTSEETPSNTNNNSNNPTNSGNSNTGKSNIQTINSTSGKTDPTTATKTLPKTGLIAIAGTSLVVLIILAIIMYKKIKSLDEV